MLYSKLRKVGDKTGDSDSSCTTKRTPDTKHVNSITLTVKLSHNGPYASLAAMFLIRVRHFDCVINCGC